MRVPRAAASIRAGSFREIGLNRIGYSSFLLMAYPSLEENCGGKLQRTETTAPAAIHGSREEGGRHAAPAVHESFSAGRGPGASIGREFLGLGRHEAEGVAGRILQIGSA